MPDDAMLKLISSKNNKIFDPKMGDNKHTEIVEEVVSLSTCLLVGFRNTFFN